ncbi:saccharopine dehydrogenase family protein [Phenylobacterium soli]|uniref:Saccharopine dehydrogenase n=1 Tax=Phenylobacterium soli TaxID=2170551 RepID=A0A328AHV6_9CAUL|nr:saccharopine dehydrogenase NADP-binding domain-containing protein [Phenylobacterium soli]RAK54392.1 saccharopine dehydrogenase [Phenylobacterium soli]
MNPNAEFDVIVYGASGYTGRLVAEHLAKRYGVGGAVKWAMAGRSAAKLAEVRDAIGAPKDTPLVVADADDTASLEAMVRRAKAVITTVGPYQLYGDALVAACAAAGTDYLDLCGEVNWMAKVIAAHDATAKKSGARICLSCGFDSIPFEIGVYFCEETAKAKLGAPVARVKGRVRAIKGGLSGGTAASGAATMAAVQKDPSVLPILMNPFSLTPGFQGPEQPAGNQVQHDEDVGADVGPFMMAAINTKNVHRSNFLMGHPYGEDFVYDEMTIVVPGQPTEFTALGQGGPKPGEGPTKEERETGFFDVVFIGLGADGRQVKVSVKGDKDPGYGSTSKMIAESALCLIEDCPTTPGGVWTPGAAMQDKLVKRLEQNAGFTFTVES